MLCRQKPKRKKGRFDAGDSDFEPEELPDLVPDEMPDAEPSPEPLIIPLDPDIEPDTRMPEEMKTAA